MHSYESMKSEYGNPVSQTIDGPILFLGIWDLWDLGISLMIILIFGIIFYAWWTMIALSLLTLVVIPRIKRKHQRGVFFHWFYRHLNIELPALINPKGTVKFSD